MRRAAARISCSSTPQAAAYSATGTSRSAASTSSCALGVLGQELVIDEVLLDERAEQGRQAPRIRSGPHAEVEVGQLGGLRQDGIEHDQRAVSDRGRSRAASHARAGSSATARGSSRRTPRPRSARSPLWYGRRRGARRRSPRPSFPARARSSGSARRARAAERCCRRRRGGSPARRRRSRRSTRRRGRHARPASRSATSRIAVSQSISSKPPSARRRSGLVSLWRPFW